MRAMLLVAMAVLAAQGRQAQGPRLVWELKLAAIAREPAQAAQDIVGLRFSPDGKWIAAVTSRITSEGDRREVVLVGNTGEPAGVKRIPVTHEVLSTAERAGVYWSPDSDYLAIETKMFSTTIVNVESGAGCDLPRTTVFGGFAGPQLAIAADWEPPTDPASLPIDSSSVTIYGADCSVKQSWKVRGHVRDLEPSAASGMIALSPEQADVRLISREGPAEVAEVPERAGAMLRFGEKGTVLCKADYGARGSLVCYEIKSGERFAHPDVIGGAPFDVSLESSIVLALQGTYSYEPFTGTDRRGFQSWIVWDYRTGRELGRLKYAGQRHGYAVSPSAIAPDGQHFVIAARGRLRMYEVERESAR